MKVMEHRPPLKRIDFGPRLAPLASGGEVSTGDDASNGYALAERNRIWELIEITARGVSARSDDVQG
jgi:hypothetical protein